MLTYAIAHVISELAAQHPRAPVGASLSPFAAPIGCRPGHRESARSASNGVSCAVQHCRWEPDGEPAGAAVSGLLGQGTGSTLVGGGRKLDAATA